MKLIRIVLVAFLVVLISNTTKASLVAYYDFDNQSDLKLDSSGTGKVLTLYDAEGDYSAEGVNGGCVDINTTTQGYRAIYDSIFPAGDVSFSTWVKVEGTSGMVMQPYNLEAGMAITIAADTYRFWIFSSTGTSGSYTAINSGISPQLDTWTHLAMTFDTDGTTDANGNYSGTFKCYINGQLVSSTTELYHPLGYRGHNNGICIGKRATTYFNGKYDDIAMFDTALNNVEISSLANNLCTPLNAEGFVPEQTTELIGYYSFDDSSNMAHDYSGNGYDLINDSIYLVTDYTSEGAVDGAAVFDGSTQGYLGDTALYPGGSFSVSFWSKSDVEGVSKILTRAYNNGNGYALTLVSGEYRFYTYHVGGVGYSYVRSYLYSKAGQWDHIAMTFNSNGATDDDGNYTGTIVAYINGYQVGTLTGAKYNPGNAAYLCFGKRATDSYDGVMDEFAVFSGVLNPTEVNALALKVAVPSDVVGYSNVYTPVAYYNFNDPNDPVQGLKGDKSGNNKHLTLYDNDGDSSDDGITGTSVDFSDALQGYRQIDTSIFPDGDFTFATWIKYEDYSAMIVQPFRTEAGFQITIASNTLRFWIFRSTGTGGTYSVVNSGISPTTDEWMHIAMTFDTDGSTDEYGNYYGEMKYYINGILQGTSSELYHPTGFRGDTLGICIGRRGTYTFNGKFDDLAIWDKALGDWQILGLVTEEYSPMTLPAYQVAESDFNADGSVDLLDFSILAENWFKSSY
ncbi:MAG: LamG domain-containing protein [Sedimentisphaeraceae bacterium JB056]